MTPCPETTDALSVTEEMRTTFPWRRLPFDPPPEYALLREQAPVFRVVLPTGKPVWLVTRYDDVRAILTDPRVSADETLPGYPALGNGDSSFVRKDDPEHARLRRLVARNFSIPHLRTIRPQLQALVDQAFDDIVDAGVQPVDLVPTLATRIPLNVLGNLLGVPVADRDYFADRIDKMFANADLSNTQAQAEARAIGVEIHQYIESLLDARVAGAGSEDDVLGQLAAALSAGKLTKKDAIGIGFILIAAGFDTTANAAALGILMLLVHPDQFAAIKADASLLAPWIEEMLRYLSHVHLVIVRTATADIEIGGATIPAGEGILPLNFSANRDPSKYPNPDELDIHRHVRDHVAFGFGVHQCVGQPLARMELEIIFSTLIRRMPNVELAIPVDQVPLKMTSRIHGLDSLPVTW